MLGRLFPDLPGKREVTIAAIERVVGAHPVFNLEVAGAHTYFVSELAIRIHNTCQLGRGPGPYIDQIEREMPDMRELMEHPLTEVVRQKRPNGRAARRDARQRDAEPLAVFDARFQGTAALK